MSLRGCSRAVGSTVRLDWLFCCNPFDTILFAMRGFRCSGSGALLAPQTPCHIVCCIILLINNKGLRQDRRIHRSARLAVLLQFLYIIILYVWLGWRSGAGAFLLLKAKSGLVPKLFHLMLHVPMCVARIGSELASESAPEQASESVSRV